MINKLKIFLSRKINNRGETGIFYIFLIGTIVVVGVALAIALGLFFSSTADIRIKESETLINRLISVSTNNGYLNEKILSPGFDVFQESSLNREMFPNPGKYYFNMTVYQDGKIVKSIYAGSIDFEVYCDINGLQYAKCLRKSLVVRCFSNKTKDYQIKILAGSNQIGASL
jgi:hypothetical protein